MEYPHQPGATASPLDKLAFAGRSQVVTALSPVAGACSTTGAGLTRGAARKCNTHASLIAVTFRRTMRSSDPAVRATAGSRQEQGRSEDGIRQPFGGADISRRRRRGGRVGCLSGPPPPRATAATGFRRTGGGHHRSANRISAFQHCRRRHDQRSGKAGLGAARHVLCGYCRRRGCACRTAFGLCAASGHH